jgi:60 kDa SS-A/Ro ribonucleoprotein
MLPTEMKNSADVWEALLQKMPMTAMIRNLAKMTNVGLLKPLSESAKKVAERVQDKEALKKARVHPIALLSALKVYEQGHGERGKLKWEPVTSIVDALNEGFYAAFEAIEPTGKNILLAIDVSGSMDGGVIAGVPGLTPRVAAAAMAMVTARSEKNWDCVGFSSGAAGEWRQTSKPSKTAHYAPLWDRGNGLLSLTISPRQRLDDVVKTMQDVPMGCTDCALPMLYANARKLDVDAFLVFTDSETWAGALHPHQALEQYRRERGRAAKLVVVGFTSTEFTIANPDDAGMMDVVGFDTAAPAVMADFIRS